MMMAYAGWVMPDLYVDAVME
eukprot:SAG31_NODE_41476_length_276_cov_0.576271_1_plen_20_part_10